MSDRIDVLKWLGTVLEKKCGLHFLEVSAMGTTKIRILARQPSERVGDFVRVVGEILRLASEAQWKVDISRAYFLKGAAVVQAMRLIFDIPTDYDIGEFRTQMIQAVVSTRLPGESDEVPLPWGGADRNTPNERGKGVVPEGTPPLILQRRR